MTTRGSKRYVFRGVGAVLFVVPLLVGTASGAGATPFASLTLVNGWTNAPFGTGNAAISISSGIVTRTANAAVKNVAEIVRFEGAIATTGTNAVPFTLAPALRPAADVFVKVDLCIATNGRLWIASATGVVAVQAETVFSNAACFTSLDGVWFDR